MICAGDCRAKAAAVRQITPGGNYRRGVYCREMALFVPGYYHHRDYIIVGGRLDNYFAGAARDMPAIL